MLNWTQGTFYLNIHEAFAKTSKADFSKFPNKNKAIPDDNYKTILEHKNKEAKCKVQG